jgi:hypothetical protein
MIFSDDMKDISAATCSLPLSDLIARWCASTHPPAPTTIDRFTVTRVVTGCFGNSARLLFRVEVIPYGGASPYAVVSSPPTRRPSVTGWSMCLLSCMHQRVQPKSLSLWGKVGNSLILQQLPSRAGSSRPHTWNIGVSCNYFN